MSSFSRCLLGFFTAKPFWQCRGLSHALQKGLLLSVVAGLWLNGASSVGAASLGAGPYGLIRSLETPGPLSDVYYLVGSELARMGQVIKAQGWFENYVRLAPDDADGWASYGWTLGRLADYPHAEEALSKAIALDADQLDARYILTGVLNESGQIEKAIKALQTLIQLRPQKANYYYDLGVLHAKRSDYKASIQANQEALVRGLRSAAVYNNLGYALAKQGFLGEAEKAIGQSLVLDPDNVCTLDSMGYVLHQQKRYEAALTYYEKSLVLDPSIAEVYLHKGQALEALQRLAEARGAYQLYLQLDPRHGDRSEIEAKLKAWESDFPSGAASSVAKDQTSESDVEASSNASLDDETSILPVSLPQRSEKERDRPTPILSESSDSFRSSDSTTPEPSPAVALPIQSSLQKLFKPQSSSR
jgi:tetratricopeptide (TPR) repeat protein